MEDPGREGVDEDGLGWQELSNLSISVKEGGSLGSRAARPAPVSCRDPTEGAFGR